MTIGPNPVIHIALFSLYSINLSCHIFTRRKRYNHNIKVHVAIPLSNLRQKL